MNLKELVDPFGLISEPTSEEMKAWEVSEAFSDNEYAFIGWLVNYRKNKLYDELSYIQFDNENTH